MHALALLELIQREMPELIGKHVPQSELARMYLEMCQVDGMKPFSWQAIGGQLRPLTGGKKTYARRGSKRFRVYKVPRPRVARDRNGAAPTQMGRADA